jgi:hypothetical protein
MNRLLSSGTAEGRAVGQSPWLQDEFIECYGRWREECTAVRLSYERWRDAEHRESADRIARRA